MSEESFSTINKISDALNLPFLLAREIYKEVMFEAGAQVLFSVELESGSAANELAEEDLE